MIKVSEGSIYEAGVYDSGKTIEITQGDQVIYINPEDLKEFIKALKGDKND